MPDVSIEIRGDWLNDNEAAFALAVHHAIAGACDVDLGYSVVV